MKKVGTLSYSFEKHIYNADLLKIMDTQSIFMYLHQEGNEQLKNIFQTHKKQFDKLYTILEKVWKNKTVAYNFLFFYDIWINNKELPTIKKF